MLLPKRDRAWLIKWIKEMNKESFKSRYNFFDLMLVLIVWHINKASIAIPILICGLILSLYVQRRIEKKEEELKKLEEERRY